MLRAIGLWPVPQNRPGGAADGPDCFWYIPAGSNEYGNRLRADSQESALEVSPRTPITV